MVALPTSTTILYGSLVLGAIDANGVKIRITGFDGWGSPGSSREVVGKPRQAGAWGGDGFIKERYMAVRGQIVAPTPELLNSTLDDLMDTVSVDDSLFTVIEAGKTRSLMVSRTDEVIPGKVTDRIANFAFQVVALDSRKLGEPLTDSTLLPSTAGGLTVPYTVPYSINAAQVSGQVNLFNPGNEAGPVMLRIDGPMPGPIVTHVESGLVFASSLALGAGEWLDIDMDRREVLANGQASRNTWVTSRGWSSFLPGDNTWTFTAAGYDPASRLTITATPADK
ncbi:MAG: hypothetical protein JWM23_540 [Microbacteriaceae bacterium]|nr:hypothetical protein [Microbacteriaceae bacterium]